LTRWRSGVRVPTSLPVLLIDLPLSLPVFLESYFLAIFGHVVGMNIDPT
jgi:hypothetical protein